MSMPTFLRPFVHIDYTDEYLDLILNKYGIIRPNYFCTYFKFDYDNSILDDRENIDAGSYKLLGNLSGRKYKKIQLLPVWLVENHGPIVRTQKEEGINAEFRTSFVLPDYYGLRPTPKDFVYFYNGVSNKYDEGDPTFQVISIEEAFAGKRKIFKVDCKNNYRQITDIDREDVISSQWIYVNFFRKIFSLDIGSKLISTMSFTYDLFNGLPEGEHLNFDTSINLYNARYTPSN